MKKNFWGIIITIALIVGLASGIFSPLPALATSPTTSITVTKYDAYGNPGTPVTLSLSDLMGMPIQGDGSTHYYNQSITSVPTNLWDPAETLNLKDKGAVRGTDIKDICEMVGGASAGDQIQVKASDGFGEIFAYDNVYNPSDAQGKMVACWESNGQQVPTFNKGIQLNFFARTTNAAGQHVFGNWDMHETMPPANWHHSDSGGIHYPSCDGLSIKYINEINIYTGGAHEWTLQLRGYDNYDMRQTEFENGLAHQHAVSWTDGGGHVWEGMPLYLLVGWVDDNLQHGVGAFNDDLALAGYSVNVTSSDGTSYVFSSATVARNNTIIVANTMDIQTLSQDEYPLMLVGPGLTGDQMIKKIVKITLAGLPGSASGEKYIGATLFINQVLSITLVDAGAAGINFGAVTPPAEPGDADQTASTPAVAINVGAETNINVDIGIKGITTGALTIGNWEYATSYVGAKTPLTNTYVTVYPDVGSSSSNGFWHWVNVPAGTTGGSSFSCTVFYKAVSTGSGY